MIIYHMQFIEDLGATNAEMLADAFIMYRTFGQGPQYFSTLLKAHWRVMR